MLCGRKCCVADKAKKILIKKKYCSYTLAHGRQSSENVIF